MRRLLALLLAVTPALAQSTPKPVGATETIFAQERLFWTNYTNGNTVGLSQQLLPEFTSVEQYIWNREQVLNFVRVFTSKCSLAPVAVLDPKVQFIAPDAATIVYHAIETPSCNGKTFPEGGVNVSTVWLLRPGADGQPHWQMHLHTEYAIPPK